MLWIPVAVALGYLVVSWLGRIWASKISEQLDREAAVASSLTNRLSDGRLLDRLGVIWWHTWSGQGLLLSGSLLRFATPSARDIVWHTQFVTSLGMVAVNWPGFAYPVLSQGAWSTLIYNVTLLASENGTRPDPLNPAPFNPPADFAGQIADQRSPLYLDQSLPNVLLNLVGQASGMQRWAALTGVPEQDLFANCLIVFLGICGGIVALSFVFLFFDFLASFGRTPLSKHLSSVVDTVDEEDGLGYPRSDGPVAGGQAVAPGAAQAPWWQVGRRMTLKSAGKRSGANEKGDLHSARLQGERVRPSLCQHFALLQGSSAAFAV